MLEKREERLLVALIFFGLQVNPERETGGIDQKRNGFWSLVSFFICMATLCCC